MTGTIARFDATRGYGFITPDSGGQDVFLHANDLIIDKTTARPGTRVSFDVEDGPRGQFATTVQLSTPHPRNDQHSNTQDDFVDCDVLTPHQFSTAITELLLTKAPTLTGADITLLRNALTDFATQHGWID